MSTIEPTAYSAPRHSHASLPEVYRSIAIPVGASAARKLFAFSGPGYLVAVGYMDPGNWATAIAGGAGFGYTLLCVVMLANMMAIVLQALSARLGIVTGRDLAQACRDCYPRPVSYCLWILAELAICATDLAEVIGSAIALNLLFGMPLVIGVIITAADVLLILLLQSRGFRYIEAFTIALISLVAVCFTYELIASRPEWLGVAGGFVPSARVVTDPHMLYVAIGIVGATVMPHNLYLHSAIVQTRVYELDHGGKREAIRYATIDSTIALMFALAINAAILIVAAATFHSSGHTHLAEIQDAYRMLAPLLGATLASTVFAIALLASGQNSAVTGTLSGQIVMEGFLDLRVPLWLRRIITRLVAIVPAVTIAALHGESGMAQLLVSSQVILSFQLPFAVIPLVIMTSDRRKMGRLVAPRWLTALAWAIAVVIIGLNAKLLVDFFAR